MEERSIPLLGERTIEKLENMHIAVFGIGGVGGFVCEALARQKIGHFTLIDFDVVNISNKNRQIIALDSTIGKYKTEVMKLRILDINPNAIVDIYNIKVDDDSIKLLDFTKFDYIVDAIDDVKAKILLIKTAKENNNEIICSCGTGNKLDPTLFKITDISKTSVCPLAKKLRYELKKLGIKNVEVLYSTEEPIKKHNFISSVSFVPSIAGLLIARHIIIKFKQE